MTLPLLFTLLAFSQAPASPEPRTRDAAEAPVVAPSKSETREAAEPPADAPAPPEPDDAAGPSEPGTDDVAAQPPASSEREPETDDAARAPAAPEPDDAILPEREPEAPETREPAVDVPTQPPPAPPPRPFAMPPGEAERMAVRSVGPSGNITYKPMAGFSVSTDDGRWSLGILTMMQFLYTASHVETPPAGTNANTGTLQIRRARLFIQGTAFSPHLKVSLQLQFSPRDLGIGNGIAGSTVRQPPVFWGYVMYDRLRDVIPQIGFFFVPYSRQRMTPPWKGQFGDSSIAAYEFGFDRDIGVALRSSDLGGLGGRLRYAVGAFIGDGYDWGVERDFGMQYVARVEILPFGTFDDYAEGDFARTRTPKLAIAGAYSFVDNDPRTRPLGPAPGDGGTTDTHNATADLVFRWAGLSILGDFFWRQGHRNPGHAQISDGTGGMIPAPVERPRNGMGWTAQAGLLLPKLPFEIAGRYSGVRALGDETSVLRLDEVGPAFSYYAYQHALKLQLDYFHQFGVVADRVRLQLTVAF